MVIKWFMGVLKSMMGDIPTPLTLGQCSYATCRVHLHFHLFDIVYRDCHVCVLCRLKTFLAVLIGTAGESTLAMRWNSTREYVLFYARTVSHAFMSGMKEAVQIP